MIYMGAELQKKLIPLFHYVLNPAGALFLGTSETVGEFAALFEGLDRKAKLYRRKEDPAGTQRAALGRLLTPAASGIAAPQHTGRAPRPAKLPLQELAETALLETVVPTGALVSAQGDVLYLHGRTGMYLEPAPGEAGVNNIIKMAREGLRSELGLALRKAAQTKEAVRVPGLRVKTNGHYTGVNLTVRPLAHAPDAAPLYLVVIEEASSAAGPAPEHGSKTERGQHAAAARIEELTKELRIKDEYLQSANEELETSVEELKSSNEEMQSVNEELQSTNEELETSKEELQSVNEELSTVNSELQAKVGDLSSANNDMNNLLAGTGIATVFLDTQLRVLRFTPSAAQLINLISSDVGRPVAHIISNLKGYSSLTADAKAVLDTLAPKEAEVETTESRWFKLRMQPYRTLDNVIEGVVVTFIDITEMKRLLEELAANSVLQRLAVVLRDAGDAVTVQDLEGRTLAWNPGAERLYGWSEAEALAMNVRDRIPEDGREGALDNIQRLSRAERLEPYHTRRLAKSGAVLEISLTATVLLDKDGKIYAVATTERAQSVKKRGK